MPLDNHDKRKKKRRNNTEAKKILLIGMFMVFLVAGTILAIYRYAPTNERLSLEEYYALATEDAAAIILDGKYMEDDDKAVPSGITKGDSRYLRLDFIKEQLDDGYVFDYNEGILRYATDKELVTVKAGSKEYSIGRETNCLSVNGIVMEGYGGIYLDIEFIKKFTDFNYAFYDKPGRIIIEKAGYEKETGVVKKDTAIRRYGGPKSKILKDAAMGDKINILENYGKWSLVLTKDGVLGCIRNRNIEGSKKSITKANLKEREYNHILMEDPIVLGWHQVGSTKDNAQINEILSTSSINVVSPTWIRIADNEGAIIDFADSSYVTACHEKGVSVWGLVSNVDSEGIDITRILNSTSARDQLVSNIVACAIAVGMDGINVDLESLSAEAKDGYIQFIRELSLRCESNDLILSVDNYKPTEYTAFYNRKEQSKYADYIIVMAYDEHYSGGETAGSVSSINFVTEACEDTIDEVPKDQVVLGLPFYSRVWETRNNTLNSSGIVMKEIPNYLEKHNAMKDWLEKEGQYYTQFTENDITYQLWIEDEKSLARKMEVYKKNDIAGVAFWKLRAEPESIWETINGYIN